MYYLVLLTPCDNYYLNLLYSREEEDICDNFNTGLHSLKYFRWIDNTTSLRSNMYN